MGVDWNTIFNVAVGGVIAALAPILQAGMQFRREEKRQKREFLRKYVYETYQKFTSSYAKISIETPKPDALEALAASAYELAALVDDPKVKKLLEDTAQDAVHMLSDWGGKNPLLSARTSSFAERMPIISQYFAKKLN